MTGKSPERSSLHKTVFFIWITIIGLAALYSPMGGDEPGYFYTILRIKDGLIPFIDFFSLQPPGFYIPYVLVAKFLSPSLEAARLVSVISIVTVTLLVTHMVHRAYGRACGRVAFIFLAASHFWFYWNIQIIHYPISNLSIVTAFYLLQTRNLGRWSYFLAGFGSGWMASSRLILGPVVVVLFYVAIRLAKGNGTWGQAIKRSAPTFILGGILAGLPLFMVFASDPEATLYSLLSVRWEFETNTRGQAVTSLTSLQNFLASRAWSLWTFFFIINSGPKATVGNLILFVPTLAALAMMAVAGREKRAAWRRAIREDLLFSGAGLTALGVLGIHFATIASTPSYYQAIFPFLVIMTLALLAHALRVLGQANWPTGLVRVIGLCLVPYVAYFLFFPFSNLIRRNEPSDGRPVTAAAVGCWIEENTAPDEVVMSPGSLPVSMAGRRLPRGFEYNNAVAQILWPLHLSDEKASRFHIFRAEDYERLLESGSLRVHVDDRHLESEMRAAPRVPSLIRQNYTLLWTTGSPWSYDIYIHNSVWRDDLPKLPAQSPGQLTQARLAKAGLGTQGRAFLADIRDSFIQLPRDLSESWARLIHAPFERRCAPYLGRRIAGRPLTQP